MSYESPTTLKPVMPNGNLNSIETAPIASDLFHNYIEDDDKDHGDKIGIYKLQDGAVVSIGPIHEDEFDGELKTFLTKRMSDEALRLRTFGNAGDKNYVADGLIKFDRKSINLVARIEKAGSAHPYVLPSSMVGHAQLMMLAQDGKEADVAFEVADVPPYNFASKNNYEDGKEIHTSTGLGSILVAETFKLAIRQGVGRIKTEVLGLNGPMNALFMKVVNGEIPGLGPFKYSGKASFGVVEYTIELVSATPEKNIQETTARLGKEALKLAA